MYYIAVSYTHLDVYKRQDYIKATNNRYDTALCKAIYNPIRKMQLKTVATYKCKGKQLQNIVMILCQKCKGY